MIFLPNLMFRRLDKFDGPILGEAYWVIYLRGVYSEKGGEGGKKGGLIYVGCINGILRYFTTSNPVSVVFFSFYFIYTSLIEIVPFISKSFRNDATYVSTVS